MFESLVASLTHFYIYEAVVLGACTTELSFGSSSKQGKVAEAIVLWDTIVK